MLARHFLLADSRRATRSSMGGSISIRSPSSACHRRSSRSDASPFRSRSTARVASFGSSFPSAPSVETTTTFHGCVRPMTSRTAATAFSNAFGCAFAKAQSTDESTRREQHLVRVGAGQRPCGGAAAEVAVAPDEGGGGVVLELEAEAVEVDRTRPRRQRPPPPSAAAYGRTRGAAFPHRRAAPHPAPPPAALPPSRAPPPPRAPSRRRRRRRCGTARCPSLAEARAPRAASASASAPASSQTARHRRSGSARCRPPPARR